MLKSLSADLGAHSSSDSASSASSSQRATPQPPSVLPPPPPPPSASPSLSSTTTRPSISIDPHESFITNLLNVVQLRMRRALEPSEAAMLTNAIAEGLSVLQGGSASERHELLHRGVLGALGSDPGAAWLLSATLEALDYETRDVGSLARRITSTCSDIAGVLFASVTTTEMLS